MTQQLNFYETRYAYQAMDLNQNMNKHGVNTQPGVTLVLNLGDMVRPEAFPNYSLPGSSHMALSRTQSSRPTNRAVDVPEPPRNHVQKSLSYDCRPKEENMTKTYSDESIGSISSSLTGSCSSSPGQKRSNEKKQRASRESLQKFVNKHSKLGLTTSLPPTTSASPSSVPYTEKWMKKKQYLTIHKQHTVRDVKFDADCNIILTTKSSVQMYDNNGVFKEKLYTNRVGEPWGLHVNLDNGHVLVSDQEDECVKEFNCLGIIVQEYGSVPTPCGVAVSTSGYVFVCSQSEACIYVFDKRARLVTIIGEGVLTSPTYLTLHRKSILVSDESRIVGFNIENEIEFVYGQADGSRHPACLCVDNHTGYVLATSYYKDKLIAFNQEMQRAIKIKQCTRPMICAISPYGNLLVGENNSTGTLLKLYRMK